MSIENLTKLKQLIKPLSTKMYQTVELDPWQAEDLFNFFYSTQLALQQLAQCLDLEHENPQLANDLAYFGAKVAHWLTPSWYHNLPERLQPIRLG